MSSETTETVIRFQKHAVVQSIIAWKCNDIIAELCHYYNVIGKDWAPMQRKYSTSRASSRPLYG